MKNLIKAYCVVLLSIFLYDATASAESVLLLKNIARITDIEVNKDYPNKITVITSDIWQPNDTAIYDSWCAIPFTDTANDSITLRAPAPYTYCGYDTPVNLYVTYSDYGIGLGIMNETEWSRDDTISRESISPNLIKAFRNISTNKYDFEKIDSDTIYFRKRKSNKGFYITPDGHKHSIKFSDEDYSNNINNYNNDGLILILKDFATDKVNGQFYGYINMDGNAQIPFKFYKGTPFNNGYAMVLSISENEYGNDDFIAYFISTKGKILNNSYSEDRYSLWTCRPRFGKSYGVINREGYWGLVDTFGNTTFDKTN